MSYLKQFLVGLLNSAASYALRIHLYDCVCVGADHRSASDLQRSNISISYWARNRVKYPLGPYNIRYSPIVIDEILNIRRFRGPTRSCIYRLGYHRLRREPLEIPSVKTFVKPCWKYMEMYSN